MTYVPMGARVMVHSEASVKIPSPTAQASVACGGAGALNPAALSVEQAIRVLAAVGARYATLENLREVLGRWCYGRELEPRDCDVIRRRYERYVTVAGRNR
jgi:hypothetical protein